MVEATQDESRKPKLLQRLRWICAQGCWEGAHRFEWVTEDNSHLGAMSQPIWRLAPKE